jgi:hypothetical protein
VSYLASKVIKGCLYIPDRSVNEYFGKFRHHGTRVAIFITLLKVFKEDEEVGYEPERFKYVVFEGHAGTFGFLPAAIAMDDRQPSCACFDRSDAKRFGKMQQVM